MFSSNTSQVSEDRLYVEDVFSTYLYTGNGSTQTITNGIDLAGKGGLVWTKSRTTASSHQLYDTVRGAGNALVSNSTIANQYLISTLSAFTSTGFTLGADDNSNGSGRSSVSWTFREAPKFFDVVTGTCDSSGNITVNHSLGVAPGFVTFKRTDGTSPWFCYHRSLGDSKRLLLNATDAEAVISAPYGWSATATTFSANLGLATGAQVVIYLFAHDTTSDGIIQCGSYTGNGSSTGPTVTLGWEPQWLLVKDATSAWDWRVVDNMRGMPVGSGAASLFPNLSNAEFTTSTVAFSPTATGFQVAGSASQINASGDTYIYIAIRRGPMRTPTLGTTVFSPNLETATAPWFKSGFATDMGIYGQRTGPSSNKFYVGGRLTGTAVMNSRLTDAEFSDSSYKFDYMTGWNSNAFNDGSIWIGWSFRRAPSFMDVVCYTGTGANRTVSHNLGVAPELIFIKNRSDTWGWDVEASFTSSGYSRGALNTSAQFYPQTYPDTIVSQPTATQFVVSGNIYVGANFNNYVAYLFASCPGVSKVGSYTGNGSSQTINCGFSGGARFVLIKRTDSTGSWWVWDTARGLVSGNDPALQLNSTAAETTGIDSVDPDSSGFIVNQDATTNINVNSGTYVYLAIS